MKGPVDSNVETLRKGDYRRLAASFKRDPSLARKPQLVVEAAGGAKLEILKLLLRHGADPNAAWRNYRALHALIQERPHKDAEPTPERLACLEWLLEHGADPEQLGAWPPARAIIVAAFTGIRLFVDRLRAAGARVDALAACALGEAPIVKKELARNPGLANNRDAGGLTALQCCVGSRLGRNDPKMHRRLIEIARLLLDAGADPNAQTRSWGNDVDAAYFAIGAHNPETLTLLLERGANATSALSSATWAAPEDLGEITLGHGALVNEATSNGRPLLNDLVRWGQVRPALWLLEQGADPNRPDQNGWTALHQAASRGNEQMFRAMLRGGGDPGRKDIEGRTPADVARAAGRGKLVALVRST